MENSFDLNQQNTNPKKFKFFNIINKLSKSRKIALIIVVLIAALGAGWLVFSKAEPNPNAIESRDVYQWPFSKYSIWNMPIGQNANYEPAGISGPYDNWMMYDWTVISMDPNAELKQANQGNSNPAYKGQVHVSPGNNWTFKNSEGKDNWNGQSAFLLPNNTHYVGGQITVVSNGGPPSWNTQGEGCDQGMLVGGDGAISLSSNGEPGCHGGSVLSTLGGVIRKSDIADKTKPIRHALSISIACSKFCSPNNEGHRLPATKADKAYLNEPTNEGCGGYGKLGNGGKDGLHMGSLLALKPDFNVAQFPKGTLSRQVAEAFRDYGAYVVDESCSNHFQISAEQGADLDEILDAYAIIWDNLHLITNNYTNGGQNIGGGGAPINDADGYPLCYAPDFSNAGFTDEIANNPNGVTDDPSCHGGTVPPPPPPSEPCPAGQTKNAEGNCETPPISKGSIAFYGDSLTGDDAWKGYIGNGLNQALTGVGYSQVYSQGCGGMTLAQFVGSAEPESFCANRTLESHKEDIAKSNTVVVAFYSNDTSSKDQFKTNAQTAITKIKEYNQGVKQIVFIKGYYSGQEGYNEAFNELATANPTLVKVIDINEAFNNDYSGCAEGNNTENHPTDDCSANMVAEIATKLGGVTPPPVEPCPAGQTRVDGVCQPRDPGDDCPEGKVKVDGQCVTPDPACPTGQVKVNGVCQPLVPGDDCPEGKVKVNGQCVTPDPACPEGKVKVNGQCVTPGPACPTGQVKVNGICQPRVPGDDCPEGKVKVNGVCETEFSTQEYKPAGTYDDNVATYSSGWEIGPDTPQYIHYNGSDHYTNRANETMTFKFKGNNVKIYGANDPNMGTAKVTIDGGTETTVNYYGPTRKDQVLVYDSGNLPDGNHTIVLKATGSNNKSATIVTASYNGNRLLATDGHDPEAETYISVDKIVVASSAVQEQRCPEGTTKQADGTCKLNDPSKDCPSGTTKQADGTCKAVGKGGVVTPDKKIDSDITKKPEAKTVAEKLVNTGRFLLLPAIVAVSIMLIASGLYVVTKKKRQ